MNTEQDPGPDLPDAPDDRLLEPPLATEFDKDDTVTIYGYIGEVTETYLQLHHGLDFRAYYRVPIAGIVSCAPDGSGHLKNLHVLQIYRQAPLRYYRATTAELTAGALADAVRYFNDRARDDDDQDESQQCPSDCPPDCCNGSICICAAEFPLGSYADQFGASISTPGY